MNSRTAKQFKRALAAVAAVEKKTTVVPTQTICKLRTALILRLAKEWDGMPDRAKAKLRRGLLAGKDWTA